ncbi:stage II sporulation protein E domain protein [Leptospira weilii serovar Ranarum str. ICFT]|uniref:Stage II sporulation protein E domain protein n=1 Tax=Leptospira weilii serovar Ranarum str. ICFT TaxID=1218598 RepID=N1WEL7_9LEPT|nr:stage II sporulation protein E domain protein [Leptospira weilii serovar Ranarum str. ICFT]
MIKTLGILDKTPNRFPLIPLETEGKLIGVLPDLFFEENSVPFKTGDRLAFYTDGISEHFSEDKT